MAPTYQIEMTKEQAEGFKKFGLSPIEYKKDFSPLAKADIVKHDYIKLGIKNIESNFDENKGYNFDKSFIYENCVNRKNKGSLFALKRFDFF